MLKIARILIGLLLLGVLLYAATLAVRDCAIGPYGFDNCLWLWVRGRLGLRPSRLGRAAALEIVGVGLLAGLYLTTRHVFPRRRDRG